jgi:uncharacterized membrane protein YgcG
MILAIIVLAVILILLLFRPRPRPSSRHADPVDSHSSGLTGRDPGFSADTPADFEPGSGDFGGAGSSGSWDSDDSGDGDGDGGGDD